MKTVALRLAFFLLCPSTFAHHDVAANSGLEASLKSWNRLKRDAGYYTESGRWRGGNYHEARSAMAGQYLCQNHTDTHCTGWSVSKISTTKRETGTCTCAEANSAFCQQWRCCTSFQYSCGYAKKPKTCASTEWSSCRCVQAASNDQYCWKWHCWKYSNYNGDSYVVKDYECDASTEFCDRWHGGTSSKSVVESSACECVQRGRGFCHHWKCAAREITRCEEHSRGWCRLEFAVGVGGGASIMMFVLSLGALSIFLSCFKRKLTIPWVFLCFILFCLPWLNGILFWGGIFGFPWVLVMWLVALTVAVRFVELARLKEDVAPWELPRLAVKRTQVVDSAESVTSNDP